jgi:hypothetical protein
MFSAVAGSHSFNVVFRSLPGKSIVSIVNTDKDNGCSTAKNWLVPMRQCPTADDGRAHDEAHLPLHFMSESYRRRLHAQCRLQIRCESFLNLASQQLRGSPFLLKQVKLTTTDPAVVRIYEDKTPESGTILERSFCITCGASIKMEKRSLPGVTLVPLGVIDGDKADLKPHTELFCRSKVAWLGDVEGASKHETEFPKGTHP